MTPIPESVPFPPRPLRRVDDYDAQWAWRGRGGKGDGCLIACSHQPIPCVTSHESGTGPGRDAVERYGIHDVKRANQPPRRALVKTTPAHPPRFPREPHGAGWPRRWSGGSVVLQLPCLIPGDISEGATCPLYRDECSYRRTSHRFPIARGDGRCDAHSCMRTECNFDNGDCVQQRMVKAGVAAGKACAREACSLLGIDKRVCDARPLAG